MPGYAEEITDIPHADASDREIQALIIKLKVFKEDEFAALLHQCHNDENRVGGWRLPDDKVNYKHNRAIYSFLGWK
jgi:hypothetical protein